MSEIVNKVALAGIITLDLEELYPKGERVVFDLKPLLWQEIALKEADLREFVKTHDWARYTGKYVSVHCSADAIIPTWAYMLVMAHLQPYAAFVTQGDAQQGNAELAGRGLRTCRGAGGEVDRSTGSGCGVHESLL